MNRTWSLVLALALTSTPAAFGMKYATVIATPIVTTVNLFQRPVNNFSSCTSESNTVAVGIDFYEGGFRILCADAGQVGFWTTPVAGPLVGQDSSPAKRYLCPSGTALAGLQYIDGLAFPFPLCGELNPDLTSGFVSHLALFTTNATEVEKISKTGVDVPGVVSCGTIYVQTLQASRDSTGNVNGFGRICNTIQTATINKAVNVDLATKTVFQTAVLGRNASQWFDVDVFNLGSAAVPPSNIILELRFDGSAWQIPGVNMHCTDILAHSGVIDRIVVGERCTINGDVALSGSGISLRFQLQPLGPEITRPATPTPQPIFSVKASIINEHLEGADANTANDSVAFPVILR